MTIFTDPKAKRSENVLNNQIQSHFKPLYKISHMCQNDSCSRKNHWILWNCTVFIKNYPFIENYPPFIENYGPSPYRKLQPLISAFIENSNFGNNRDPCIYICLFCSLWKVVAELREKNQISSPINWWNTCIACNGHFYHFRPNNAYAWRWLTHWCCWDVIDTTPSDEATNSRTWDQYQLSNPKSVWPA